MKDDDWGCKIMKCVGFQILQVPGDEVMLIEK